MKYILLTVTILFFSCKKEWFDAKPNSALVVPTTLNDFQALLDNYNLMNESYISLGEVGSDNYFVDYSSWVTAIDAERNASIWNTNIFENPNPGAWVLPYQVVFYSNIVIDGVKDFKTDNANKELRDQVLGSALFFRGYALFDLVQVFAHAYGAPDVYDPAIPLRLSSDPNVKSVRNSLLEVYTKIIDDLQEASRYLPATTIYKARPSKAAVFGLLARMYLNMGNYAAARTFADSCLNIENNLIDFNNLDYSQQYPIPLFNIETVFYSLHTSGLLSGNRYFVDSNLYKSYDTADLRKKAYFAKGTLGYNFVGSYAGAGAGRSGNSFTGIAVDEMYLIRAECNARVGNYLAGMEDLNKLLEKRYVKGTFVKLTAQDASEALALILKERRKELIFRGLRWSDLRRLNLDADYRKDLSRKINGQEYNIPPNSSRYTLPIPLEVINANPGMVQNPR